MLWIHMFSFACKRTILGLSWWDYTVFCHGKWIPDKQCTLLTGVIMAIIIMYVCVGMLFYDGMNYNTQTSSNVCKLLFGTGFTRYMLFPDTTFILE